MKAYLREMERLKTGHVSSGLPTITKDEKDIKLELLAIKEAKWKLYEDFITARSKIVIVITAHIKRDSEADVFIGSLSELERKDPGIIWKKLESKFKSDKVTDIHMLNTQFHDFAVEKDEKIRVALTRFKTLLQRMKNANTAQPEPTCNSRLLSFLAKKDPMFTQCAMVIINAHNATSILSANDPNTPLRLTYDEVLEKIIESCEMHERVLEETNSTTTANFAKGGAKPHFKKKFTNKVKNKVTWNRNTRYPKGAKLNKRSNDYGKKHFGGGHQKKFCSHCKRNGHNWDYCFFNPKSPQFRPNFVSKRGVSNSDSKRSGGDKKRKAQHDEDDEEDQFINANADVAHVDEEVGIQGPDYVIDDGSGSFLKVRRANVARTVDLVAANSANDACMSAEKRRRVAFDTVAERNIVSEEFVKECKDLMTNWRNIRGAVCFGSGELIESQKMADLGIMENAMIVPGAHADTNLCSLAMLADKGMPMVVFKDKLLVYPPNTDVLVSKEPVLKAKRQRGLYVADAAELVTASRKLTANCCHALISKVNSKKNIDCYFKWHYRLCHCDSNILVKMAKHGSCKDLSNVDVNSIVEGMRQHTCLHCPLGYFPQFPVGRNKSDAVKYQVGESFSIDCPGKFTESYGGANYFYLARDKISGFLIEQYHANKREPIKVLEYLIARVRTAGVTI